jgi:Asp-tRNA(Asn)/Glu-tRNA(Gln) amidotransferase B subunit
MLKSDEISSTNAQEVVKLLLNEGGDPDTIVNEK